MIKERFTDDGIEEIVNQSFTDNLTGKTYWIDNGLDEIVGLLNELWDQTKRFAVKNKGLQSANMEMEDYCARLEEENQALKSDMVRYEEECRLDVFKELHEENERLKQAYTDAKRDVEKKEQILKDIMEDNLLIQDIRKELENDLGRD